MSCVATTAVFHSGLMRREEPEEQRFEEASFQHLCMLMKKTYNTCPEEMAAIRVALVECDNRPDKHAFFLQLANGKRHRSVRQLELEWAQQKAAKETDPSAPNSQKQTISGALASATTQSLDVSAAHSEPSTGTSTKFDSAVADGHAAAESPVGNPAQHGRVDGQSPESQSEAAAQALLVMQEGPRFSPAPSCCSSGLLACLLLQ